MSGTQPLRVVIADGIPVVRHLMRFFLEEDGFEVLGETARGDELVELVRTHRPDAVVLHERLADAQGLASIPGIRAASPDTRIAMCTRSGGIELSAGTRGADVYLEEGLGLKDLAFVLRTLCESPFISLESGTAEGGEQLAPVVPLNGDASPPAPAGDEERHADQGAWWSRLVTSAAVAITVLAFSLFVSPGGELTVPPPANPSAPMSRAAERALEEAELSLAALVRAIEAGASEEEVARLTRDLVEARMTAEAAGADLSGLDALIAAEVGSVLPGLPPSTALVLRAILGPLIPPGGGIGPGVEPPRDPGQPGAQDEPVAGGDPGDEVATPPDQGGGGNGDGTQGGDPKGGGKNGGKDDEGDDGNDGGNGDGTDDEEPQPPSDKPGKGKGRGKAQGPKDEHPGKGPKKDDKPGRAPQRPATLPGTIRSD
jgi:CheY-like chemotaxis protein